MVTLQDAAATLCGLLTASIASFAPCLERADDGAEYALLSPRLGDAAIMLCPSPTIPGAWVLVALPSCALLWTLATLEDIAGFAVPATLAALVTLWETLS